MIEPPICSTMVLCNHAIRDARSVYSLLDVMREVHHESFPVTYPSFWLYAEVTNAKGAATIDVRLNGPEGMLLREGQVGIDSKNPLDIIAVCVEFKNVEFPGPGLYVVEMVIEGHPLQERRLRLTGGEKPANLARTPE